MGKPMNFIVFVSIRKFPHDSFPEFGEENGMSGGDFPFLPQNDLAKIPPLRSEQLFFSFCVP